VSRTLPITEVNTEGSEILPAAPLVHCDGGIEALRNVQEGPLSLSVGRFCRRNEKLRTDISATVLGGNEQPPDSGQVRGGEMSC
jgi:hypothetical protein